MVVGSSVVGVTVLPAVDPIEDEGVLGLVPWVVLAPVLKVGIELVLVEPTGGVVVPLLSEAKK